MLFEELTRFNFTKTNFEDSNSVTVGHLLSYLNMRTNKSFRNRFSVKILKRLQLKPNSLLKVESLNLFTCDWWSPLFIVNNKNKDQWFVQFTQLQWSPQLTPCPKHSQYFFWQADFLQLHPFFTAFFWPKDSEAFTIISSIALARTCPNSSLFLQQSQPQPSQ
jgi:hypothetical protein